MVEHGSFGLSTHFGGAHLMDIWPPPHAPVGIRSQILFSDFATAAMSFPGNFSCCARLAGLVLTPFNWNAHTVIPIDPTVFGRSRSKLVLIGNHFARPENICCTRISCEDALQLDAITSAEYALERADFAARGAATPAVSM